MKTPYHPRLRLLLRENPEGLTARQLGTALGAHYSTIRQALEAMPDTFIDRWVREPGGRGQYTAIWCVITPPPNCPHPTDRTNAEVRTTWNHRHTTLGAQP